jgi:hypothetical protein
MRVCDQLALLLPLALVIRDGHSDAAIMRVESAASPQAAPGRPWRWPPAAVRLLVQIDLYAYERDWLADCAPSPSSRRIVFAAERGEFMSGRAALLNYIGWPAESFDYSAPRPAQCRAIYSSLSRWLNSIKTAHNPCQPYENCP